MKKIIYTLLVLGTCALQAADAPAPTEFSMPLQAEKPAAQRVVRVKVDIADSDVAAFGIQSAALYNELTTRLGLAAIQIKEDPKAPELVLRVKAIQADRAVAAYIQLAFYEEAALTRNQSTIEALTWSQATMLSCAKEDLSKEIMQVVVQMANGFVMDYQKAMVPI